jgi:hypothetical protein
VDHVATDPAVGRRVTHPAAYAVIGGNEVMAKAQLCCAEVEFVDYPPESGQAGWVRPAGDPTLSVPPPLAWSTTMASSERLRAEVFGHWSAETGVSSVSRQSLCLSPELVNSLRSAQPPINACARH